MLGLEPGVVRLAAHDSAWALAFKQERDRILGCIGAYLLDVQHVGSTAIPDIPAKPVLDIAVAVDDFELAQRCIQPVENLGFTYRGEHGIPRRHTFVRGEPRTHHVHMLEITSGDWLSMIQFRDLLCADPDLARDYAALKSALAATYPRQRACYQDGKKAFILRVLHDAAQTSGRALA